ncbi:MAG: hypothetical protein JWO20_419 [Candidatus Angelobacter sp.]|nr:hypothetical protein [Candidatus Angelobacter sp.]
MLKRILVFGAICATALAQDAPVGIVTLTQGSAQIFEPGAKRGRKLDFADVLRNGSRIVTGGDGKVKFVSCAQSIAAQAQPNSEIQFGKSNYEVKRGSVEQPHQVPSCLVPLANVGGRDSHIGGINMRGDTIMQLLSPVGTSVDPGQVKFVWQSVEGASNYRLAVRDGNGNDFWEQDTNSSTTSLQYASPTKLMAGASYRWRVTALQGEEVLSSASAKMTIFSAEDLSRIDEIRKSSSQASESHLMLGMLFEELNAPDLALAEYEKLSAMPVWLAQKTALLRTRLKP